MTHVTHSHRCFTKGLHGGNGTTPMQTLDRGNLPLPHTWWVGAAGSQGAARFTDGKVESLEALSVGLGFEASPSSLPPFLTEVPEPRGTV